ncbi:MAG: hypothetical protein KF744_15830 [Taibaiella sp.]|nr:hypothetical protein [Taibaiella sp.]
MKIIRRTAMYICLIVCVAACKKKDDSPAARLKGKWKAMREAFDMNGDYVPNANEFEELGSMEIYMVFNGDGTGVVQQGLPAESEPMTYSFTNGNAGLHITYPRLAEMFDLDIQSLSSSDAVLRIADTSSTGQLSFAWLYLKKQ